MFNPKIKTIAAVIMIVLISGLITTASAWAGEEIQPKQEKAKEPNAAEFYGLAFEALQDAPANFREEFLTERFPELPEPLKPLTPEEIAIFESGDVKQMSMPYLKIIKDVMSTMLKATKIEPCDWKLDPNQDPEMQAYYLEPAKKISRLGCLRADYFMEISITLMRSQFNKDSAAKAAVTDLVALMKMARCLKVNGPDSLFLAEFEVEEMVIHKTAALYSRMQANTRDSLKKKILTLPEAKIPSVMTAQESFQPGTPKQKIFDNFEYISELRRLLREGIAREVEVEEDGTPKAFTLTSEKMYEDKPIELVFDYPLPEGGEDKDSE